MPHHLFSPFVKYYNHLDSHKHITDLTKSTQVKVLLGGWNDIPGDC